MDSEARFFMAQPLFEYHQSINKMFYEDTIPLILIKKIRAAVSDEEAILVWEKYKEWPFTSRFFLYETMEKVDTLKKEMAILDYFGIDYPPPPDPIRHFFETQFDND